MKPGDLFLVSKKDGFDVYQVEGVYLGALGQENLIELRCLTKTAGSNGKISIPTVFVPDCLLAGRILYRAVS